MKNNNYNTQTFLYNLLESNDFKTDLQFEAAYGVTLKGGHQALYLRPQTRRRIVDPINILAKAEKQELIHSLFISKN